MSELGNFPFVFKPNVTAIDRAMREFAASAAWLFEDIIGQGLITLVNTINRLLGFIPWFVMVLFVFALGWRARGSLRSGILYAAMLCAVGVVGLWQMMYMTLSIVLASVLLALNTSIAEIRQRNMKMIQITKSPLNNLLAKFISPFFFTGYAHRL